MEKNKTFAELQIKLFFLIVAIICSIFVIGNIISFFPLFKSLKCSESELWATVNETKLGVLYNSMCITEITSFFVMLKEVLYTFLYHIEWYCIVFLFSTLILLVLKYFNYEWKLINDYLFFNSLIILFYIMKYLFYGLGILIFFKDTTRSMAIGLIFGNSFGLLLNIAILFIFMLYVLKFLLSVVNDIQEIIHNFQLNS